MSKSILGLPIVRKDIFRTPLTPERRIGLWVDRIGEATDDYRPYRLRILGQYQALYVQRGEGEFLSPRTGLLHVPQGSAVITFPEEPYKYYGLGEWHTQWIVWNGPEAAVLERIGYISSEHPLVTDTDGAVSLAHRRLSAIMQREDLAAVLERMAIVLEMVLALHRSGSREAGQGRTTVNIDGAIAYCREHYAEAISIPMLAKRHHMSAVYLRRLFKARTGQAPRGFINAMRISHAKALLAEGHPIKEVAAAVGFEDIFYFMRAFKKIVGSTPGRFGRVR